jgi:hypothetical protein
MSNSVIFMFWGLACLSVSNLIIFTHLLRECTIVLSWKELRLLQSIGRPLIDPSLRMVSMSLLSMSLDRW